MNAGLSRADAARRLAASGRNEIAEARGPSRLRRFLANFVGLFALLLWAGAALALVAGTPELSVAIAVVIAVNAVFSFVQEFRAEQAVAALRRMLPSRVTVRRDGAPVEIASEEVVVGDVLLLSPGDRVAADADLEHFDALRVDESTLTGESVPVSPSERVYAGTYVTAGVGEAVVTATGMATRFGRIAELTQRTRPERSPLERELDRLTRVVAVFAVAIGVVFFVVAGLAGMAVDDRFVFAIGVTVALVPEGLLPTVTLSLALATQRMARRNALVRRLSAVETLGETTVICTDKTGTLTENRMTVQRVWTLAGDVPEELLRAGLLCNDVRRIDGEPVGDPTEIALVALAEEHGVRADAPRLAELPFSSERRRMTTVHSIAGTRVAYTKGAVEAVLPLTTLAAAERDRVVEAEAAMEHDALRVLALTRRADPGDDVERDLELLGLVGMLDPPRAAVPAAVARCRAAGIRIVMVTGDSGRTAEAIARRIGLVGDRAHVITGDELAALDDDALRRVLAERDVIFARIDPEQKLRLAHVLQAAGEIVAMTGDGVNDAPALRQADIGVAMGRGGTEVAKHAADLILVDDDFASVVAAVEEGRAVYDNIRRFAGYHFCSNVGELVPFLVWGISGGAIPLPLVVMQVLAIDLGTDQIPAIALGTERAEPGTMTRPPRPRGEHLLTRGVAARVFAFVGPIETVAALASFLFVFWLAGESLTDSGTLYLQATTMTMAGIVMAQVGAGLAWRTNRLSLRAVGWLSNRLLLVGIAVEVAMIALLAYTPGLDRAFHTAPLELWHWLFLLLWPVLVLGAEEARKAVIRRRPA